MQGTAQPGQCRTDEEDQRKQPCLINAKRAQHVAIIGCGPDKYTKARTVEQQPQTQQNQRCQHDQEQVIAGQTPAEHTDTAIKQRRTRAEQLGRSPYRTCQILYDEYEGEAGKQRQQLITPVEAAEHDNLECHTDEPDRNGGKRQGQPESGNLVEW